MVETHQDDGGEEKACGDDQQKDIAEVEKLLVLGGPPGPGPQGHHTGTSHQRHDGRLWLLFVKNSSSESKIEKMFFITWRLVGLGGQGLVPPKLWLYNATGRGTITGSSQVEREGVLLPVR